MRTLRLRPWHWAAIAAAGALGRLAECVRMPASNHDLPRHLATALLVLRDGWRALSLPLSAQDPSAFQTISWGHVPYNYPIGAVGFFCLVGWAHPSLFFAKLVLSTIEGANAVLVSRLTGSRLAGFAYWLSPISLWWVSHEGAFEPVQNLFLLLAFLVLARRPLAAGLLLGIAIQVKLGALFALPLLLIRCATGRARWLAVAGGALSAAPSAWAAAHYAMIRQILSTAGWETRVNPWHWNLRHLHHWDASPRAVLLMQAALAASIVIGLVAAIRARRSLRELGGWGAPLALMLVAKIAAVFQPWYWILQPAFLSLAPRGRAVVLLAVALPFVEPLSSFRLAAHAPELARPIDRAVFAPARLPLPVRGGLDSP